MVSKKFVPVSALLATAIRISAYPGRKNVIQKKNNSLLESKYYTYLKSAFTALKNEINISDTFVPLNID